MGLLVKNNVRKVIAQAVTATDTEITLVDVTGLPDVSGVGDYTVVTLIRTSDLLHEIVQVDNIVGNVLTVVRAQEDTIALTYSANDEVRNLFTAAMFDTITYLPADKTKVDFLTVTQAVDLDQAEIDVAASKVKTDHLTVTQAVDLDQLEIDVAANTSKVTNATHTGDATGDNTLTLATVNGNVGSFTSANITVNAKGLVTAVSNGSGGGGGGNFPTSTDSGDKTTAYSIVAGDENTTVVAGSATSADFTITYDLSLWTTAGSLLTIVNESAYIVKVVVSNTGTMTIGGGIDKFIGPNGTITMAADTATHVRVVART